MGAGGIVDPTYRGPGGRYDGDDDGEWLRKIDPGRYAYYKKHGMKIGPNPSAGKGGGAPTIAPPSTAPKPGGPVAPTPGVPGAGTPIRPGSPAAEEPSMAGLRAAAGEGGGGFGDIAGIENLGGPSIFRQGIGTRIPPQYSQSLAALMKVY